MTSPDDLSRLAKSLAADLGFDDCRITSSEPVSDTEAYHRWLSAGMHGGMAYMARTPETRSDPAALLQGVRSIIVVALGCWTEVPQAEQDSAIFATYARNLDYHDVIRDRLKQIASVLQNAMPGTASRICVDSAPLLERAIAERAGIGWFGKNTMLIATRRGSHFLLGELLTTAELAIDPPAMGHCGTCHRCLDACPTGALVSPHVLDARRCLSYMTIENREQIPDALAARLGNRIFGCDICQEVCPFNRRAQPTSDPDMQPRTITTTSTVTGLLRLTDDEFREAFRRNPVTRAKRRGLLRNAAAALSARDDPEAIAALERTLSDPEPLVREQAQQSLEAIRTRATHT